MNWTLHLDLYATRRRAENVKDETINRDLRTVCATLNQAKLFFDVPNFQPPKVRYLKVEKSRRERIVSSVELKMLLVFLLKVRGERESEKIYLTRRRAGFVFLLSAVTGARPGELTIEGILY